MLSITTMQGRLVNDPTMRQTGNGTPVCGFRIAVDRDYCSKGEKPKTDFISCTAWRSTAEFVDKFFTKGRLILVTGRIEDVSYIDKTSGIERRDKELNVSDAWFGDSKKPEGIGEEPTNGQSSQPPEGGPVGGDQEEEF